MPEDRRENHPQSPNLRTFNQWVEGLDKPEKDLLLKDKSFLRTILGVYFTRPAGEINIQYDSAENYPLYGQIIDKLKDLDLRVNIHKLLCNPLLMETVAEQYPQYFEGVSDEDIVDQVDTGARGEVALIRTGLLLGFPKDAVLEYAHDMQQDPSVSHVIGQILFPPEDEEPPYKPSEKDYQLLENHFKDKDSLSEVENQEVKEILTRLEPELSKQTIDYCINRRIVTLPNGAQFTASLPMSPADQQHCDDVKQKWNDLNLDEF